MQAKCFFLLLAIVWTELPNILMIQAGDFEVEWLGL